MIEDYTEPEDFLMDDTFKKYCEGSDVQCVEFWENWQKKHSSKRVLLKRASKLYRILNVGINSTIDDIDSLKQDLDHLIWKRKRQKLVMLTAAACFFLVSGLVFILVLLQNKNNFSSKLDSTYVAVYGQRKKLTLSDGTIVFLNSGSKLELEAGYPTKTRKVRLTGEAFFDVKHDSKNPFYVFTKDFKVTVLGTAFNVKSYPSEKDSETTLLRGSIKLEDNASNGNTIILKQGQKIIYHTKQELKVTSSAQKLDREEKLPKIEVGNLTLLGNQIVESGWINNDLIFSNIHFAEIEPMLERWFNVDIEFKQAEIENYTYTASFKNEDLITILHKLQEAKYFSFEKKGGKIIISK